MAIKISDLLNKKIYTTEAIYVGKVFDAMIDTEKSTVGGIVIADVANGCLKETIEDPSKKVVLPFQLITAIGNIILIKPPITSKF
ncbi:sporulation protein YlmC with PRC-barrel domain [Methanococcus voltae]|uniref:Sporulation protein YlmC with PRC-barrel domain n=2 Tax=Methanococcus voltae TaxID=2188 RepID=A0A8J7USX5_METVO|nr:PRC-barrel domain-containing protein [Methanococcus voltae]MBP2142882.1 sporulation protein YlmC with PRC-barrel domain [Methanococcus voltae]MBP2171992.1 sporulation protein YlmC with PRC-barrel domain [Methanococcus voltae]MBP2201053.1 sporulation protein YlmC with PRC-barrel domain [Methanococcus voltae]MCS3921775.1 sporulation protein YlmC with PRC-barrel domain [Methanococcus voltae PS]